MCEAWYSHQWWLRQEASSEVTSWAEEPPPQLAHPLIITHLLCPWHTVQLDETHPTRGRPWQTEDGSDISKSRLVVGSSTRRGEVFVSLDLKNFTRQGFESTRYGQKTNGGLTPFFLSIFDKFLDSEQRSSDIQDSWLTKQGPVGSRSSMWCLFWV